jgi:hypothetical protein
MLALVAPIAALAVSASPACGLPPLSPGARPWSTGEALTYDLDLFGAVKTGTLLLSVERPISGGTILTFRALARSNPSLPRRIAAVALSWVEPAVLLPERYRDESEEDGLHRGSDTRLRPPASKVTISQQYGDQRGEVTFDRQGDVLDPVSALYFLRAATLRPGERACFDLVALGRYWHVEATVAAKVEKVTTPAGRFETIRVDATARRADRPEVKRPVHLWFSTDGRKLPVAAVSEIDLGPVSATLASVRSPERR